MGSYDVHSDETMLYPHENPFNRQIHTDTCTLLAEADALTVTCYCGKSYLVAGNVMYLLAGVLCETVSLF